MNEFGRYIDTYCALFMINQTILAERAGIRQNTLSTATRGTKGPSLETVEKVWSALRTLAEVQGGLYLLLVTRGREQDFYASARFSTEAGYTEASERLRDLSRILE